MAQSVIFACAVERNIQETNSFSIYVLGNRDVCEELSIYQNQYIGNSILKSVKYGKDLPNKKPDVLVLTKPGQSEEAVNYCRENKVLSITCQPELCFEGVTLGVASRPGCTDEYKETICYVNLFLNLESSKMEQLDWYPNMIEVSTLIDLPGSNTKNLLTSEINNIEKIYGEKSEL